MYGKLRLALLGTPQVTLNGNPVSEFKTSKAQALLYYLAATRKPHLRASLATLLWGDFSEDKARVNLSTTLSEVRRLMSDYVSVQGQTISLWLEGSYWLDVECLETSLADWTTKEDITQLVEAVDLYRGDFLQGFHVHNAADFEDWQSLERDRLRDLAVQGLHILSTRFSEQGEWSQAIEYTKRLLSIEPWREEAHRQLMRLYAQTDQLVAALNQYQICVDMLEEEYGLLPGDETTKLADTLREGRWKSDFIETSRQQDTDSNSGVTTSAQEQAPLRNNLPTALTSFVGRHDELAQLDELLACSRVRLVSIVGPGGIARPA